METFKAGSVVIIAGLVLFAIGTLFRAALFGDQSLRPYLRAAGAGLVNSLVLFVVMILLVEVLGVPPFNMAPSAAFLEALGWGFFGLGGPGHSTGEQAPLHLGSPVRFLVMTLVLHIVYGAINGWLIPRRGPAAAGLAAEQQG